MKTQRTHDAFYLTEDRKKNPKEYFKFVGSFIKKYQDKRSGITMKLLDVGCATGEFLYYLDDDICRDQDIHFYGMDIMDELINKARTNLPDRIFLIGDISNEESLPQSKFDVLTMLGVHSIFDNITGILANAINLTNGGGKILIFGIFNPVDYDVLVKVKASSQRIDDVWESGWNCWSLETVGSFLKSKGLNFSFHPFNLNIDIAPNASDPLRSFTQRLADGSRQVINGTQLVHNFYLLEIDC
jgi:SAM-dependent methyltransferase